MDGLDSVDVRLRRAESRGEPETRVYLAGALADELSARVCREDERSHPGGRHGGVPRFDRAERAELGA